MRFLGFSGKGFWLKRLVSEDRGEIEENREKLKKDRRAILFYFYTNKSCGVFATCIYIYRNAKDFENK